MKQYFFILLAAIILFATANSNAQVNVTSSDSITCTHPCTNLKATFYGDVPINSGISIDDFYTDTTNPIGFDFNFYGNIYHSCLIGPNGSICFDTSLISAFDTWVISGPMAGDPALYNTIAGPYCDIDIVYGGTITYSTDGVAPFRKFVVTYCATHMFSCTTQYTTSQIILYETTNIAEVHIAHKTVCAGWNGGYAIVGVQNADGSASTVAPGRDYPSVWTGTNEAWRFTPDTSFTTYTVDPIGYASVPLAASAIYWYDAGTDAFLGTGDSITVCPTTTTTYKAGALGCADTSFGFYTVVSDGFITITTTHTNPTSCAASDGTITVGGLIPGLTDTINYTIGGVPQPPYVAVVAPDGTITITGLSTDGFPSLDYTGIFANQGGCTSNTHTETLVNPGIPITVTGTSNPTVCGYKDGTITLSGYYPSTIYTISFDSAGVGQPPVTAYSTGSGTITLANLYAGVYDNFVSSGGPCPPSAAGPATLTDPAPPVVTVDSAIVKTCVGIPAQLDAYVSPAGITYYYTWTSPVGLSSTTISNPIATPVFAGDVVYTVTANPSPSVAHCASTATVDVHAIEDFTLHNNDTIVCLGHTVQGSITGSAEISYAWTPSFGVVTPVIPNATFLNAVPGTITYTVTGSYAHCPDYVHSFTIVVDTPATPIVVRDTICLGMTDSFNFAVPGSDYYHYQWIADPPTGISFSNDTIPNPIITPSGSGFYNISVNIHPAALGCDINDYLYLDVLPNVISVSPTDTSVCSSKVIQVIGNGDPTFSYQWLPTAGIPVSNVLNALIHPDTSTDYTVVASFHRCPDIYAHLHINVDPQPSVYIGGYRFVCENDTIHINTSVTPATGTYSYTWSPAAGLDNTTGNTVVFDGNTSGMIYVSVNTLTSITTLDTTCRALDSAFVTVYPGPSASIISQDFCPHDSSVLTPTPASASYHWYPSYYLSDSMSSTPVIKPITTQVYTVVASTDHGCKDTISFTATVHPAATILLPDSVTLYPGESYNIEPVTNCVTFSWFPPAGLSSTIISNPVATPELSTKYIVTGTTENGCVTTDSISIIVDGESLLAMPNAFTPGTGANNVYKILLRGVAQINYFRIYNRWGNLVFETKNINEGWDGNYKGQAQPMDAYIYEVQAVAANGKIITKHGNITLLR